MKVSIQWCLDNLQKAYRILYFDGTIEQLKQILLVAKEIGHEYTDEIPEELIKSMTK